MEYSYYINSDYIIESVNDEFEAFARANGAGGLAEQVIGTSLLDFISNPEVRLLYTSLIDKVMAGRTGIKVPLRCDSPDTRREMVLKINPADDQKVCLNCCLIREEKREPVALLQGDTTRSEEFVTMCSWCKKIQVQDDDWVEVEDAVRKLELLSREELPKITHGICAACHEELMSVVKHHKVN